MSQKSIPGIILAAGKSRRMGKNKLLLPMGGKPLLQHVIDAATQSVLSPLILVVGGDSCILRSQINTRSTLVVENSDPDSGYSFSLQVGLRVLNSPCLGAMFLLGDQPLVISTTLDKLVAAFLQDPDRWVAPSWKGQRGNPVITPSAWFDTIYALTGDTGPRKHLNDPVARLKRVEVHDRGVVFDIDNPDDYDQLIKMKLPDTGRE